MRNDGNSSVAGAHLQTIPGSVWTPHVNPEDSLRYFARERRVCASCGRRFRPRVSLTDACGVCGACEPHLDRRPGHQVPGVEIASLRTACMAVGHVYGHCASFNCDVCGVRYRHIPDYWAHPFVLDADGRVCGGGAARHTHGIRGIRCEFCWNHEHRPQLRDGLAHL